MLKIKKVVETEVELPAPEYMVLTWKNPTFSQNNFLRDKTITIGEDVYQATSLETRKEEYTIYQLPDIFIRVGLEKVRMCHKENS